MFSTRELCYLGHRWLDQGLAPDLQATTSWLASAQGGGPRTTARLSGIISSCMWTAQSPSLKEIRMWNTHREENRHRGDESGKTHFEKSSKQKPWINQTYKVESSNGRQSKLRNRWGTVTNTEHWVRETVMREAILYPEPCRIWLPNTPVVKFSRAVVKTIFCLSYFPKHLQIKPQNTVGKSLSLGTWMSLM